ncbi:MAG: hypothetical protein KGL39_02990 [Patescibacteria group bacterium]|nr:hypothetical protein [Patescibacteria group bacterium]
MKMLLQKIKQAAKAVLPLVILWLASFGAQSQTFSGLLSLSGTNTAPILLHFQTQSNISFVTIQPQTLVVTNINTNESITVSYFQQQTGVNVISNSPPTLITLTTNFPASAGWTNGATWTYNIPGNTYYFGSTPWGYLSISNGQFPSGTCTNGVGLQ